MVNKKELMLNAIKHESVPVIPMMYRADQVVSERLLKYFNLGDLSNDWESLTRELGADNYSDGETLGAFTSYVPKYSGPAINTVYEINHFFIWGIKPVEIKVAGATDVVFHRSPPLYGLDNVNDVLRYDYPKLDWFDFDTYKVAIDAVNQTFEEQEEIKAKDIKRSDKHFLCTYTMNSIFMTSLFMRGIDNMLMDLISNKRYSEILISSIGSFCLEFCKKNLGRIGSEIDLYGIWDDFATQDDLLISPEVWRKYYKPWHSKIIEEAKKHDLLVCFHICGNCSDVIPDLIEMGVDILDPVQVSANKMEIGELKKQYGRDICFHGGLDAQRLVPLGKPDEIKKEVKRVKKIFGNEGGIILGPSHYLTPDIPIENVLAIYDK